VIDYSLRSKWFI